MSTQKSQAGFALISILILLSAFFLLALALSQITQKQLLAATRLEKELYSYYTAQQGIERAKHAVARYWHDRAYYSLRAAGEWYKWTDDKSQGAFAIQDESGKMNLARMPVTLVTKSLGLLGLSGSQLEIVKDSLRDWVDKDDVKRPQGAEADYYRKLPQGYSPRNAAFQSPAELAMVKGLNPAMVFGQIGRGDRHGLLPGKGLWSFFSVYNRSRKINVNAAPPEVLLCLPGIDQDRAMLLLQERQKTPLKDYRRLLRLLGQARFRRAAPYLSLAPGRTYSIISQGKVTGSSRSRSILAVVRVSMGRTMQTLFWLDDLSLPWPAGTGS
ncbi:MAG: type II secretion system protein GspK [Desulfarculaceae bacterium]|jgi:general secretion pathway protein K